MKRRSFLVGGSAAAASAAAMARLAGPLRAETFDVVRTEAEWRQILNEAQFSVLRKHATERPGSSPLLREHRKGIFHCAGCDLAVYPSETKFDSGTGWPSFWDALPGAIGTSLDRSLSMERIEVHCRRCGGHFGHIFDDGPPPTGKRHCLNGLALAFRPATA